MKKQLIYTKAVIEKGTDDTMRIIASTEAKDRDGEVIKLSGWDTKAFKSNPVLLWAHKHGELPLGKFLNITKNKANNKLEGTIKWASETANPFVKAVKAQFEEGIMNSFSVGFIPRERDVSDPNIITKAELLEVSVVPVPANPGAMSLLSAKGFGDKKDIFTFDPKAMKEFVKDNKYNPTQLADFIKEIWSNKTVVPFKSYKLLDKVADWNIKNVGDNLKAWATIQDIDKDIIDFSTYKEAFAWFDESKANVLSSYKFAHHDYQNEIVTNWRGVTIAMADLLGENGTDIPENERKRVYDHLSKHYKEFGEEAPKFASFIPEVKLTEEYKEIIQNTISTLQGLIAGSDKALENGNSMHDLSDSDKEDVKTELKVAKLLSEMIMRNLNNKK